MPARPLDLVDLTPMGLYNRGVSRVTAFCEANDLLVPSISWCPRESWEVGACAYYRKDMIHICLEECARPATEYAVRNWNWPGSSVDREPYGVLCHELGHHVDYHASENKGPYYGEYGGTICEQSGEQPISGYHPNDSEWFAEMFRLFVTNHALLYELRPRTWDLLTKRWQPVSGDDWRAELGADCPARIVVSQVRKANVSHKVRR